MDYPHISFTMNACMHLHGHHKESGNDPPPVCNEMLMTVVHGVDELLFNPHTDVRNTKFKETRN